MQDTTKNNQITKYRREPNLITAARNRWPEFPQQENFGRISEARQVEGRPLIQVRVSGVSALREIIGKDTVVILKSDSTLGQLISKLEEQFGSAYREMVGEKLEDSIKKRFNLLYNGQVIPPEENLDKALNDGDEILFFQLAGA